MNEPGYFLHHLASVLDRQSDAVLQERLGVGFAQFKILTALTAHDGLRQKRLAHLLGQTEASISRQVHLMEQRGLITSRLNPRNRREHIIALSRKGMAISERAARLLNSYHAPVFARLSMHQTEIFHNALRAMHDEACRRGRGGACELSY